VRRCCLVEHEDTHVVVGELSQVEAVSVQSVSVRRCCLVEHEDTHVVVHEDTCSSGLDLNIASRMRGIPPRHSYIVVYEYTYSSNLHI
jgi:hypothetical protein